MQRRKVKPERLEQLLAPTGFALRGTAASRASGDFSFVRRASIPRFFEHLVIGSAGKTGEAVWAKTFVSGCSRTAIEDVNAVRDLSLMYALASDSDRGHTIISNMHETKAWEIRLASLADQYCLETTTRFGQPLADRLAPTFDAVDQIVTLLGDLNPIFDREFQFHVEALEDERATADALEFGFFHRVSEREDDLKLACLALARWDGKLTGHERFIRGLKMHEDRRLLGVLDLLADAIEQRRDQFRGVSWEKKSVGGSNGGSSGRS